MAVVDDKYRFIIVDIGAFGRNSDGGIFASSKLARRLESNSLDIPNDKPLPGSDRHKPHVFIGDEAFPLMKNLMRPYPRCRGLSKAQTIFNERLSRACKVVEDAFGILYQKFGIYNNMGNCPQCQQWRCQCLLKPHPGRLNLGKAWMGTLDGGAGGRVAPRAQVGVAASRLLLAICTVYIQPLPLPLLLLL
ncbi:hypothetical protein EVAR_85204_1 [Eumeta japonica]|uniref:DDE Tnp4 domain-containing protein n=1 Tax=Eumeta variegata TaxID=151549 RepID=A0A4C1VZM3_EUMVA|nr:hypothetical protein EVAR_85204_1 [Eumeta japonica]